MANEMATDKGGGAANALGSFEDKIREFQGHFKELANVQNLDELKAKWDQISTQTREEIEQHPLQMVALGGMLGFSLGLVGKKIDVKEVSTRVVDWAAKLGASWAVEKISDHGVSKDTDRSIH